MTREEWKQVKELLHRAMDLPPAERSGFLENGEADENLGRISMRLASTAKGLCETLTSKARGAVSAEYASVPDRIHKELAECNQTQPGSPNR